MSEDSNDNPKEKNNKNQEKIQLEPIKGTKETVTIQMAELEKRKEEEESK